ncbi:MAG TPA: cellulase family glycosylhydrolase [Gaiellaceae bacterium]|nr:cellulase family glycosylhydrolase [Gaiellaceae bacterium]
MRRFVLPGAALAAAAAVAATAASIAPGQGAAGARRGAATPPTIRVQGRRLVDGAGRAVQLRGVNRAAFESRCTYDAGGFADGPVDQASVAAMKRWRINAVRVTLNEDCWLGVNGLPVGGDAAGYRDAVRAYVSLLRRNGLYVMPVVEVFGPDTQRSTQIDYLPDRSHILDFWRSFAAAFKSDRGLIFDPVTEVAIADWNDPHPDPPGQWACWLHGCTVDSVYEGAPRFASAGVQAIVDAIRQTGAKQPIVLGGIDYNADLTQLLTHLPTDPAHQLVASFHVYDFVQGKDVDATFGDQLEPIAKRLPVVLGELGERRCDSGSAAYTKRVLGLIDAQQRKSNSVGVFEWAWNAGGDWRCPTGQYGEGGPLLIRGYDGTPTVMGRVYRTWLAAKR